MCHLRFEVGIAGVTGASSGSVTPWVNSPRRVGEAAVEE